MRRHGLVAAAKDLLEPAKGFLYLFKASAEMTATGVDLDKARRNAVYRWCALIMAGCLILIAAQETLGLPSETLFWGETVAISHIRVSWMTKSQEG